MSLQSALHSLGLLLGSLNAQILGFNVVILRAKGTQRPKKLTDPGLGSGLRLCVAQNDR